VSTSLEVLRLVEGELTRARGERDGFIKGIRCRTPDDQDKQLDRLSHRVMDLEESLRQLGVEYADQVLDQLKAAAS